MGQILVGCAGWHYQDWVGALYPPKLGPQRWLQHYATVFPIVEIDSTFYAIPAPDVVRGWTERVRDRPDFGFTAKLPQDVTHRAMPAGRMDDARRIVHEFLERVVEPLEGAGRYQAVLLQCPPTFEASSRCGTLEALDALSKVLGFLEPDRRRVAVEFRHGSWFEHVGERLGSEPTQVLTGLRVALAQVDGLGFRTTSTRTTPWSYFRFHGRRDLIPAIERGGSNAPYNYLYPHAEMQELANAVGASASKDESTIVIFNNHYRGQAAKNAAEMMVRLGQPRPPGSITVAKETRLDEFIT